MKHIILIAVCLYLGACTTVGSVDRPQSYYDSSPNSDNNAILNSNSQGLQDEKINALLYEKVKLPKKIRIAILKLSRDNYWRFYSNDFTQLNDSISKSLIEKLRSSNRVYDASFLPSMLIPEKRTVPILREAAARFQADVLLAYRSSCNSYQKYRFLSADETKSYCSVEAVLLDIRKGIIVKSIVTTQEFHAKKDNKDTNFSETIKKAELEAISKALGEIANEIVKHLKNVAVLG